MSPNDRLRLARFARIAAFAAAVLLTTGTAAAQKTQTAYVRFQFESKEDSREYPEPERSARDLAEKFRGILEKKLRVWCYETDETKYPRLLLRLQSSDAAARTLYLDLVVRAGGQETIFRVWDKGFPPDPNNVYDPSEMERKILEALSEELRYEDRRRIVIDALKDKLPLNRPGAPLARLLLPRPLRGLLPLEYSQYRELARSEFLIDCEDKNQVPVRLRCKGLNLDDDFLPAGGGAGFRGIVVQHTRWADQAIDEAVHGPRLRQLIVKRYYLAEYTSNPDDSSDPNLPSPAVAP
jgi:hypothetical protein